MAANPQYATLTANVVTTVDVTDSVGKDGLALVKVTTDDNTTAPIYFRTDGTDPVVAGAQAEVLLSGGRNYEVASIAKSHNANTGVDGTAVVKLISAAAAWVKVEVIPA
jgi:hypothetical protein